ARAPVPAQRPGRRDGGGPGGDAVAAGRAGAARAGRRGGRPVPRRRPQGAGGGRSEGGIGPMAEPTPGPVVPDHHGDPLQEYQQARCAWGRSDGSDLGRVEVAGPDARTFLHNLTTNDIRNLPVGAVCEAFLCTATAKVIAYVRLACLPSTDAKRATFLL